MKRSSKDPLLRLVQSYFDDHLRRVRGASRHTLRAYSHGLRLFFAFLADHLGRSIARLRIDDIQVEAVLAFLDHVESKRRNTSATRNCRLAAIRGFVAHLLRNDIERAAEYQRILAIPSKKSRSTPVAYLEPEVVAAIIAQPDRTSSQGTRDHALLLFLYNTGARVSEVIGVQRRDLQLARPHHVRLHGKGNKERICPLWPDTAAALVHLLEGQHDDAGTVFRNRRGKPLSRDGIAYLLKTYTRRAADRCPALQRSRVSPHVFRHSCAVALLQAGVDVSVIRDYLGHSSIATTSRYVTSNLQMKREVLDAFWKRSGLAPGKSPPWHPKPELLRFLTSL
jgi:site-specific recombinase XerD